MNRLQRDTLAGLTKDHESSGDLCIVSELLPKHRPDKDDGSGAVKIWRIMQQNKGTFYYTIYPNGSYQDVTTMVKLGAPDSAMRRYPIDRLTRVEAATD